MAIAKPPVSARIERRAEELIDQAPAVHAERAGKTNGSGKKGPEKEVPVTVRIPQHMLDDIERMVAARPIKTARHTWLMEAIHAKWRKEKQL
jgi:hypothetical protein